MRAADVALRIAVLAGPLALVFLLLRRTRRTARGLASVSTLIAASTCALGAAAYAVAWVIEGRIEALVGLDPRGRVTADVAALVYTFFVAAPLEQGLKVAAIVPARRSERFVGPLVGIAFAALAALGFVTAHNAALLFITKGTAIDPLRALLAVPAHLFFAAAWGYVLGKAATHGGKRTLGGAGFNIVWFAATLFNGVYDHIVFARSAVALLATGPVLAAMAIVAYAFRRDLLDAKTTPAARRFLPPIAPPSMEEMRAALRRTERPVMITWIGFGALVTTGVMTAALAGAVALGHRVGVDFAAVDRGDATAVGAAPLVLLGGAALAAFPIAGYLVARASAARSVLEPAISAALAIAGTLVLLGLAAPVSVVFAIAFAPIAFGLACTGAWLGIAR